MSNEESNVIVEDLQKPAPVQPEQPPVEAAPENTPEDTQEEPKSKKEELFSSKFANLTRKEREILKKEQELKALQEELGPLKDLKKDPQGSLPKILESFGLSVDDVITYALNQAEAEGLENDPSPEAQIKRLEKKLTQIEQSEQEKQKKLEEDRQKAEQTRYSEAIEQFKGQISAFVEEKAEIYELIAAQNATDTVFEVIEESFNRTGKVMDIEEAANLVENYLEEEAKKILLRSKKLKAVLPVDEQSQALEGIKENTPKSQDDSEVAKTLTEDAVVSTAQINNPPLTREESLKRAAAKLKWS